MSITLSPVHSLSSHGNLPASISSSTTYRPPPFHSLTTSDIQTDTHFSRVIRGATTPSIPNASGHVALGAPFHQYRESTTPLRALRPFPCVGADGTTPPPLRQSLSVPAVDALSAWVRDGSPPPTTRRPGTRKPRVTPVPPKSPTPRPRSPVLPYPVAGAYTYPSDAIYYGPLTRYETIRGEPMPLPTPPIYWKPPGSEWYWEWPYPLLGGSPMHLNTCPFILNSGPENYVPAHVKDATMIAYYQSKSDYRGYVWYMTHFCKLQHHRLPPAGGGGGPSGPSVMGGGSGRLSEFFDLIRNEFESASQDGGVWKAQRDEYESKMQQQINELAMIRQVLYELESNHAKARQDYEGEINRLRRELEARGGPPAGSPQPDGPPPIRGDGNGMQVDRPFGGPAGSGLPPLNGEGGRARSPFPPAPSLARPPSSERERERDRRSGAGAGPGSPPVLLSDLDPENVSRELKKEGGDWFAVWSSQSKKQLDVGLTHTLNHETVVCCVKFSNDGKYLATGCNRTAQIYDVKSGAKVCVLLDESTTRTGDLYIRSICFSPDGKYLATGAEDRQIRIWDIKAKRIRHLLTGHMQEIYSLDFSRDGRYLVSGSGDKSARIWEVEKGQCVFDLRIDDFIHNEHGPIDAGITSVALSPDGKLVAAGSLDTMVRVWNVATGQQVERLKGHKDSVYSVAFSPDGKQLVSGSLDRTLRVWDLSATKRAVEALAPGSKESVEKGLGTCQSTLNGHKDYVLSVAISPDGQWVVSGSKDRSIQFWNIATGQAQFMLQGHKNSVISIDLARSGGYLASGSGDCMARIWKYEPAQ